CRGESGGAGLPRPGAAGGNPPPRHKARSHHPLKSIKAEGVTPPPRPRPTGGGKPPDAPQSQTRHPRKKGGGALSSRPLGPMLLSVFSVSSVVDSAPHAVSTRTAPPWPPPTQSVASPRRRLRRRSSFSKVTTSRVPVAPTGWPRAIAPPLTFS